MLKSDFVLIQIVKFYLYLTSNDNSILKMMLQTDLFVLKESLSQSFQTSGIRNLPTMERFIIFPTLLHHLVIIDVHYNKTD